MTMWCTRIIPDYYLPLVIGLLASSNTSATSSSSWLSLLFLLVSLGTLSQGAVGLFLRCFIVPDGLASDLQGLAGVGDSE